MTEPSLFVTVRRHFEFLKQIALVEIQQFRLFLFVFDKHDFAADLLRDAANLLKGEIEYFIASDTATTFFICALSKIADTSSTRQHRK